MPPLPTPLLMPMMPPAFRKPAAPLALTVVIAIAAILSGVVACTTPAPTPLPADTPLPTATPEPTAEVVSPATTIIATPTNPDQVSVVTVGPYREECVGVAPQMCLLVNDALFYDEIDGFDHQPGYYYRLRIEQYDPWHGQTEIPQDASRYAYRLLEILDQQRVTAR